MSHLVRGRRGVEQVAARVQVTGVAPGPQTTLLSHVAELYGRVAFLQLDLAGIDDEVRRCLQMFRGSGFHGVLDAWGDHLLTSQSFQSAAPELVPEPLDHGKRFTIVDPLLLEGAVAAALRDGGPYRQLGSPQAVQTARQFRETLIGERFDDLCVLEGFWDPWFLWEDGWSHGWLITDLAASRAYLLCMTATD